MIKFELLRDAGVLIVAPKEALTAEDFRTISSAIDPYIASNGKLTGLLLEAPSFPGSDSLRRGDRTHDLRSRPPPARSSAWRWLRTARS